LRALVILEQSRHPEPVQPQQRTKKRAVWGTAMRARQLIDSASFGPDALKAIGTAFDAAWAEIADHFGNDPNDIENARYQLANAILSIATDSRDVEVLKKIALQRMAIGHHRASDGDRLRKAQVTAGYDGDRLSGSSKVSIADKE